MTGEILFGMHSIYTVLADGRRFQCRIKGKVLRADARAWNPIAPGDIVELDPDPLSPSEGRIVRMRERRTVLERWNKKGRAPQALATSAVPSRLPPSTTITSAALRTLSAWMPTCPSPPAPRIRA